MSSLPPEDLPPMSSLPPENLLPPTIDTSSRRLPLLIGVLIGLLAGVLLVGYIREGLWGGAAAAPRPVTARGDLAPEEKATIELFDRDSPSVVYITSLAQRRGLFGLNVFEVPQGTGSGFVWDKEGHVVTNFHVIVEANALKVTLFDHTTWDATVVGAAPGKDLAVLQISAPPRKLTPIMVGTSKDLRVGQRVFAIGNPFGLDYTLTTGIISALGRTIPAFNNRTIDGVIQTDAAINPGNSGGPLLDSAGRLVGVNTQIASPSGGSAGIGFAVPVDTVNDVVPQIIAHGKVVTPILGIQPLDDSVARQLRQEGVIIGNIVKGSGAAEAGLHGTVVDADGNIELGDVITRIDGHAVKSYNDLMNVLEKHKAGDTVPVEYLRDGKTETALVTLQAAP